MSTCSTLELAQALTNSKSTATQMINRIHLMAAMSHLHSQAVVPLNKFLTVLGAMADGVMHLQDTRVP